MDFVEPSYFGDLDTFRLKWRWIDEKWAFLSTETVKSIRPYTETRSRDISEFSLNYGDANGLFPSKFDKIERFETSCDSGEVRNWLREHVLPRLTDVVVSWDQHHAVLVRWDVFCDYWNDFCYPSSDDVAIFPTDMKLVLFYFHDEYFELGLTGSLLE